MNENTRASMGNAIGEVKVSPKSDITDKRYEKSDSIFAVIYMFLGYAFIRFFFIFDWGTNFDFALPLYTLAYIFTVIFYAKAKEKDITKESWFWIAVMLCVAFLFKIENFFRLVIQIPIAAYFTASIGGMYCGGTSAYIWADLIYTFISAPFLHFGSIFSAFFALFKYRKKKEKFTVHPAVWGGVAAVAALWVIVPLLIKADSNFLSGTTDFINHLFAAFSREYAIMNLAIYAAHIVLATPVACYLYSLNYSSVNNLGRLFDKDELDVMRNKLRISPAVTLKVFILVICFVYMLFIALQAEYLLGAFMGRLYSGMTYAEYARTGFFELCKVAGINLSLLAISNLLIKKDEYKNIKLPMAILCVLSLLLLSAATAKMTMYISVYGLTVKRVISTVFLLWLIVVFVMCIIRIYNSFNLVKAAVITGAVMFCILFSFDIGLHCHNFNEKYGFTKKIPVVEFYPGDNTLHLPQAEEVIKISVSDSDGNIYDDIVYCGEIMELIRTSSDTDMATVQDFPNAQFYYIVDIYGIDESIDTIYIYRHSKTDCFYIEQPYNVICRNDFNWDSILAPYKV